MKNIISQGKNYLPEDHRYFTFLKKVFRHEFRKNWFRRISTVFFENLSILENIYDEEFIEENIFKVKWDKALKTNPSIWNMLAYLNENLWEEIQPIYLYYIDNYFSKLSCNYKREENYLIWWDIIWESDPIMDAMLVYITYSTLNKIWLENKFSISLNCVLNDKEFEKYIIDLKDFYYNKKHLLSESSLIYLEKNALKLLDSTLENEIILAKEAPKMLDYMKKNTKTHFNKFVSYLDMLSISYKIDNNLFSEFTYNSNTIWNFKKNNSNEVVSCWWRYDNLSKILWEKKEIWWVWFNISVENIIEMLKESNVKIKNKDELDLYFVQLGDDAKKLVFNLSLEAREKWIKTMLSIWTPSMKEQILKAQRAWAKFIVIVWVMEAKSGNFQVRDTINWTQEEIQKEKLLDYIIEKIWEENLDFYCPVKDLIIE